MIDVINIVEKFGEEILLPNLSSEDKYVYNETQKVSDEVYSDIGHLVSNGFNSIADLTSFVSEITNKDINLSSENFGTCFNEILRAISEYKVINPFFSKDKHDTWDENFETLLNQISSLLNSNQVIFVQDVSEVRAEISNERIRKVIYEDLDENSILLLYGLVTGNYTMKYEPDMRATVFNNVKNNREKSRAYNILLNSLKENATNFKGLLESYGFLETKMLQKNVINIFEHKGKIHKISKISENTYDVGIFESTRKLNESVEDDWSGAVEFTKSLKNGELKRYNNTKLTGYKDEKGNMMILGDKDGDIKDSDGKFYGRPKKSIK